MKTINKIITKLSTKYGAPMGRSNIGNFPINGYLVGTGKPTNVNKNWPLLAVFDCAVSLSDGYDSGGAYWGCGKQLRVRYTKDLSYIEFYRKG